MNSVLLCQRQVSFIQIFIDRGKRKYLSFWCGNNGRVRRGKFSKKESIKIFSKNWREGLNDEDSMSALERFVITGLSLYFLRKLAKWELLVLYNFVVFYVNIFIQLLYSFTIY